MGLGQEMGHRDCRGRGCQETVQRTVLLLDSRVDRAGGGHREGSWASWMQNHPRCGKEALGKCQRPPLPPPWLWAGRSSGAVGSAGARACSGKRRQAWGGAGGAGGLEVGEGLVRAAKQLPSEMRRGCQVPLGAAGTQPRCLWAWNGGGLLGDCQRSTGLWGKVGQPTPRVLTRPPCGGQPEPWGGVLLTWAGTRSASVTRLLGRLSPGFKCQKSSVCPEPRCVSLEVFAYHETGGGWWAPGSCQCAAASACKRQSLVSPQPDRAGSPTKEGVISLVGWRGCSGQVRPGHVPACPLWAPVNTRASLGGGGAGEEQSWFRTTQMGGCFGGLF